VSTDAFFHPRSREFQDRFETRRLADRIEEVLLHDRFDANDRAFIESRDMFFLATADEQGRPQVSYKGGDVGFVKVVDDATLAFPNYNGNGMYLSMGNIAANPHVGMLFIDFERRHRMRVNGEASIHLEDPLVDAWPEAQFVVRVQAREIFPNCPRYIHRMQKVEPSAFVPRENCVTPVPEWKQNDWAVDVLPADDPARDPNAEVRGA
jgi:predicted pyridoxine 5'-phosphate oxidase superfamily flavin-nucleotide-binding protein